MSAILPSGSAGYRPPERPSDPVEFVEPGARDRALARWELRALQWRAAEIAEAVFGGPVGARALGGAGQGLRGMLELEVPFDDLEGHRAAEARFLAWATRDELLAGAPLVVVFTPVPTPAARPTGTPRRASWAARRTGGGA